MRVDDIAPDPGGCYLVLNRSTAARQPGSPQHKHNVKVACEQSILPGTLLRTYPESNQFCTATAKGDPKALTAAATGHQLPESQRFSGSLDQSDSLQDPDQRCGRGTPSPICDSNNAGSSKRQLQLMPGERAAAQAAATMHAGSAVAGRKTDFTQDFQHQQQQRQQQRTAPTGSSDGSYSPGAARFTAALPMQQEPLYRPKQHQLQHQQQHQQQQHQQQQHQLQPAVLSGSSSAAACSSATATAPQGSGHSGLGSSTPAAAAAAAGGGGGGGESQSAVRSRMQGYQAVTPSQHPESGFGSHSYSQGFAASTQHVSGLPGQPVVQGSVPADWNQGVASPDQQGLSQHDLSMVQSRREPLFRSSSTNPVVGVQFAAPPTAAGQGYQQSVWQQQQQQQQYPAESYGAAAVSAPAAVGDVQMRDISMQYHSLAAQQQLLRKQLSDLQQQEKVLLQRQASAAAGKQIAPAAVAAASEEYDPQLLAAWQSFAAEGMEDAPMLPLLRIKSSPHVVAAAPAAPPAAAATATKDVWQQFDQDPQQDQQQQVDESPVCVMDSSGGSDSSGPSDRQQVAAVVADIVDNIVVHTKQPAAGAADELDELTSSGDNGHDEEDMAAATAAAMSWMMEDLPDTAAAAAATGPARSAAAGAAGLEPMDSCSPMLPSSRRKQQHQSNMPGSAESMAAAAASGTPCRSANRFAPTATPAAGSAAAAEIQGIPGTNQGPRLTPPLGAVQSGPMSNNGICMLDVLDFADDLVPAGMVLDDLLDFGSPPPGHRPVGGPTVATAAAAAAGHDSMHHQQQQLQYSGLPGGNSSSRRSSWGIPSPLPSPHFQPQQQQQQQQQGLGFTSYGPSNCMTPPPPAAAAAGSSGIPVRRISNPGLPPIGFATGTAQPQHRQVAASGLHNAVPWHVHPPGRPTVTTGANQGYHHSMGPHVVSTFQQQQQRHAMDPYMPDYAPQRGNSMTPRGPDVFTSSGPLPGHPGYQPYEARVPSMASCPPDMLSNMSRGAAAAAGYCSSFQQQHYEQHQQQQPMMMSPRTHSWSGTPSAAAAAGRLPDELIDAHLESIMAEMQQDAANRNAAANDSWQQGPERYSNHASDQAPGPQRYYSSSLPDHSRPVTTREHPEQVLQYQQQRQQQQQQPMHPMSPVPRLHQHGDSPFSNAQAQNAHFHSLGLSGPMSGSGPVSLGMPGSGPDSLRVSGPGYSSLGLPGPPQMLAQHHSLHPAPYPDRGYMQQQQQQQYQQPADMSGALHRAGSAPVMPSQLHMQASGPGSYPMTSGFNPAAGPSTSLRPAPSAPHAGPAIASQGLYSYGSAAAKPLGLSYSSAVTTAQQQQMKIKLKVQLQPVKRGRGRPPSRARLAAKEVDIIPVPVRDHSDSGRGAAGDTAAASGIKYLDAPSSLTMPAQQYSMYNSSGASVAADMSAGYAAGFAAAARGGYGSSEGLLGASQLQRKRSGQTTGLESQKSAKSLKMESSSSGTERANSLNSNSSGNSSGIIIPKKKSGMPMPIMRNGVLIPPPAGPEMTARGKPTFADLVQAGAFPPGTYEFSVGTVQSVTASISSGGIITYENDQYQSISSFALAAARSRNPNRQACDGWKEVRLQGKKLELWRQAFLNKLPPPAIPAGCIKTEGA